MLKLRVKTLIVQPSLEHFQIICGFENSWEFPFCAKYFDGDCRKKNRSNISLKIPLHLVNVSVIMQAIPKVPKNL